MIWRGKPTIFGNIQIELPWPCLQNVVSCRNIQVSPENWSPFMPTGTTGIAQAAGGGAPIRMLFLGQMYPRSQGTSYGGFLKWWYQGTIAFPTKNDQHLGWRLRVPPFEETPYGKSRPIE